MTLPINSGESDTFVVVVSSNNRDQVQQETFVFNRTTTIGKVFATIFDEDRTSLFHLKPLPFSVEIYPDFTSLPQQKSPFEMLEEGSINSKAESTP